MRFIATCGFEFKEVVNWFRLLEPYSALKVLDLKKAEPTNASAIF